MPTSSRKQRRARERAQAEAVKNAPVAFDFEKVVISQIQSKQAHHDDLLDAVRYGMMQGRHAGKHKALAAAYGMSASGFGDYAQAEQRMQRIHREAQLPYPIHQLTPVEQRWARAFYEVYIAGPYFYAQTLPNRRRYLEQHYMEMAAHDTPKGRKAAKVVAHFVASGLDDLAPPFESMGRTMGGRLLGKSFDRIIIDELTSFKSVKEKPNGSV